jgi:intracellular sulfur oxidation DsrE/DsrF family protein
VTTEEKLDRVADNLDRLTSVVSALASSVVAHDNQIESLLRAAEKHEQAIANLERQWQAYINTLPRQ